MSTYSIRGRAATAPANSLRTTFDGVAIKEIPPIIARHYFGIDPDEAIEDEGEASLADPENLFGDNQLRGAA